MSNPAGSPDNPDSTIAARTAAANLAKLEAEVETARATALKTAAEAETARATSIKTAADAATANTAAAQADDDLRRSRATSAATSAQTVAEARQAEIAARTGRYSSLVPALNEVKAGSLALPDGPAVATSQLAATAMQKAAQQVAVSLSALGGTRYRVLVTTELELADSHATYVDVTTSLTQLTTAVTALIAYVDKPQEPAKTLGADPLGGLGALASAIPGVLSLLSANRSLRSATIAADVTAAVASVIGQVVDTLDVVHATFRPLPGGAANPVYQQLAGLAGLRVELVARQLATASRMADAQADKDAAAAAVSAAAKSLAANTDPAASGDLERAREDAERDLSAAEGTLRIQESLAAAVQAALMSVDAFVQVVREVPAGSARSPLATAALYGAIDATTPDHVDLVLFVTTSGGETTQSTSDRALWLKDRVSLIAEVAVTFVLVDIETGLIKLSGTHVGVAQVTGTLGSALKLASID